MKVCVRTKSSRELRRDIKARRGEFSKNCFIRNRAYRVKISGVLKSNLEVFFLPQIRFVLSGAAVHKNSWNYETSYSNITNFLRMAGARGALSLYLMICFVHLGSSKFTGILPNDVGQFTCFKVLPPHLSK